MNWDALVAVGTLSLAAATLLSVLVALFGERLWRKRDRPRLVVTFHQDAPYCRYWCSWWPRPEGNRVLLATYWVRLKVKNQGRSTARGCLGKMMVVSTDGELRRDRDPMLLRWAGTLDRKGFQPSTLAPGQFEFLNVARVGDGIPNVWIESLPDAPGFSKTLEPNREHQVEIVVFADNAEPVKKRLKVHYGGRLGTLNVSVVE